MEVGHSRLLKYIIPSVSIIMSEEEYKVKFEYQAPPGLESGVPEKQELREPNLSVERQEDGVIDKDEEEITTHDPMTTREVFENPLYSEVWSEVIPGPQEARQMTMDTTTDTVSLDDRKGKSRIPRSRFKTAAEKVKQQKLDSEERKKQEVQLNTKRRSSIPKLQKSKITPASHKDSHVKGTLKVNPPIAVNRDDDVGQTTVTAIATDKTVVNNEVLTTVNVDRIEIDKEAVAGGDDEVKIEPIEDFDQIYEDIVGKTKAIDVDKILESARVDDVDKVESNFEQIIHDYDENKNQPIKVYRSRIPLVKRKSLHDIKLPKKIDRRFSLNDNLIDGNNTTIETKSNLPNKNRKETATEGKIDCFIISQHKNQNANEPNVIDEAPKPKLVKEAAQIDNIVTQYDPDKGENAVNIEVKSLPLVDISKNQVQSEIIKEKVKVAALVINKNENLELPHINEPINTVSEKNSESKSPLENSEIPSSSLLVRNILKSPTHEYKNIDNYSKQDTVTLTTEAAKIADPIKENYDYNTADTKNVMHNGTEDSEITNTTNETRPASSSITPQEDVSLQTAPYEDITSDNIDTNLEVKVAAEPLEIIDFSNELKHVDSEFVKLREDIQIDDSYSKIHQIHINTKEERTNTLPELSHSHHTVSHSSLQGLGEAIWLDEDIKKVDGTDEKQHQINKPRGINEDILISKDYFITENLQSGNEVDTKLNDKVIDASKEINIDGFVKDSNEAITLQDEMLPMQEISTDNIRIHLEVKEAAKPLQIIDFSNELKQVDNEFVAVRKDVQTGDFYSKVHQINTQKVPANSINLRSTDISPEIPFNHPNARQQSHLQRLDSNKDTKVIDNVDKKLNQIDKTDDKNEESPPARGKISRIISRLTSQEPEQDMSKKIAPIDDMPKKREVSSKIAMFERQSSHDIRELRKPKIVNEIFKISPNNSNNSKQNNNKQHTILNRNTEGAKSNGYLKEVKTIPPSYDRKEIRQEPKFIEKAKVIPANRFVISEQDKTVQRNENSFETKSKYAEIDSHNQKEVTKKLIIEENEVEIRKLNVEDRVRNMRAKEAMRRSKSLADVEIGDVVKGNVNQILYRIKSKDELRFEEKKEVINAKERPRKKSVLEKIALFERKETTALRLPTPALSRTEPTPIVPPTPIAQLTAPPTFSDDEYRSKIKSLNNAKLKYGSMGNMTYVKLGNGADMPVIAVGTALLDPVLTTHIISAAIDLGYRAIDSAFIYGNEKAVGEGIRAKIQDGTVQRQDLFIINKLWSTFHRPDLVEKACRDSLEAMGLEYFDLYLIHNPMSFKEGGDVIPKIANVIQYSDYDYMDAWFAMENLVRKDLVKNIGVSNFNSSQIARVAEKAKIKPVVNQVECHPYLSQDRLAQFCADRNITLFCFGVLGSKGTPAEFKDSNASAIDDPLVNVMSAGLGISPAQLLVRYQIESGRAVVVKASSPEHLWDNLHALNARLGPSELDALHALNKNKRTFVFKGMGDTHKNYPFRTPF